MIPPKLDSSSQYCPSLIMGKLHFDIFHSAAYFFISQQDDQVGSDLDRTSSNPYKMRLEEYFNPNPESNTRGKTLNNFKTCDLYWSVFVSRSIITTLDQNMMILL